MQVTETLSEGLKRGFTVVVPAAEIEDRRTARLTDLSKTIRLPGFRPGKVPLPIVRQRYGTAITAEVLEESVNQSTRQLMEERGLRPALQPKVDVVSLDTGTGAALDLEFRLEMELLPEITLPDFATINLTRLKAEVTPETIEEAMTDMASRNATLEEIPAEELGDRGAAKGEVVTLDYAGKVGGEAFPGGTGTDLDVEIGGTGFIPGFSEQLEGIKPGESRTIEATFPDPYGAAELAGKQATFEVTAKKLSRKTVPELDEAFAQKLAFENLDELRDLLRRRIQQEYDALSRLRLKRQLLDALAGQVEFVSPQGMVDQEFNQIWQRLEAERKEGRLDDDDKDKDEDTLRSDYRAIAERRVRLGLLLAEIGRLNNIQVTPDEMTRAMRAEAGRYPGREADMMEFFRKYPAAADSLRGPIFEEKVVDYVLELAQITEQVVTRDELAQEPPVEAAGSASGGGAGASAPSGDEPAAESSAGT